MSKLSELAYSPLRYKYVWFALGCAWLLFIVVASLIDLSTVKSVLIQDKAMHLLAYGFLMGWFAQIFKHSVARLILAVVLILLGVGMEYMQSLVPSRQFDLIDMLANTTGVLLAWVLSYTILGNLFSAFENLIVRKL